MFINCIAHGSSLHLKENCSKGKEMAINLVIPNQLVLQVMTSKRKESLRRNA